MPHRPPRFTQRLNAARTAVGARRIEGALRAQDVGQAGIDRIRKTYRWRQVRAQVLREQPCCAVCQRDGRTALAVQVDHIVSLREAPHLAFVRANLQGLCGSCHARKNAIERRTTPRHGAAT